MSYRIDHTALTVIWTDPRTGETSDLNASGEPCTTLADLREFVATLHEQGFLDAAVRDQLLHDVGRDEAGAHITHHCDECGEEVEDYCHAHPTASVSSVVNR